MLAKFHQILRFWKFSVIFIKIQLIETFSNFDSSSMSNLDKFLWGKLFLISSSFYPYFIWNFWNLVSPPFDQISLNLFELI
jgi:hypothetical protein